MNVKRSLQSRIRGWFPEEPKGLKLSFAAKNPIAQGIFKNPKEQVTPELYVTVILLTITGLFTLSIFDRLFLVFDYFGVMSISCALIGAFLGTFPAYKILKTLSKGGKTRANLPQIIYFAFILVIGTITFYGLVTSWSNFLIFEPYYAFFWLSLVAIFDSRFIFLAVWERKYHCKIWMDKRLKLFIIQKSSQNQNYSLNNQKLER